jgi:hypothetical protein
MVHRTSALSVSSRSRVTTVHLNSVAQGPTLHFVHVVAPHDTLMHVPVTVLTPYCNGLRQARARERETAETRGASRNHRCAHQYGFATAQKREPAPAAKAAPGTRQHVVLCCCWSHSTARTCLLAQLFGQLLCCRMWSAYSVLRVAARDTPIPGSWSAGRCLLGVRLGRLSAAQGTSLASRWSTGRCLLGVVLERCACSARRARRSRSHRRRVPAVLAVLGILSSLLCRPVFPHLAPVSAAVLRSR